jgi:hypothetical protein
MRIEKKPYHCREAEILPEVNNYKKSTKPYKLDELIKISENDSFFVNQALKIFIENSEEAVRNFGQMLEEENWEQIGETAHRILPSYRHLEVETVIPKLVRLKNKSITDRDPGVMSKLINETISEINNVIIYMKNELG